MVKTKIIATLGPASSSETILRKMILSGLDVVRLNFSHGTHSEHSARIALIRKLNKKYRRGIKILQDLQGPRIRIGRLKEHKPIYLEKRHIYYLTQENIIGENKIIPFDYKGPLNTLKRAEFIFIDDGNIILKIKNIEKQRIKVEVVIGGLLRENKGINIPGVKLDFPLLSKEDEMDLLFGIEHKVDFVAQSFVRTKEEVIVIRERIKTKNPYCKIIAKIENEEGLKNIEEIMTFSDGIMIARGDLGVSIAIYKIPVIQKHIIKRCKERKRFVITATQMLESMVENFRPTRAEVSDVANAIIDGTDYLMLSAETAVGKYPVETVKMMNNIIKFTESSIK